MAKSPFWFLLALLAVGQPVFAETGSTIQFSWAFLVRGGDGSTKAMDYSASVVHLESGDRIKILLKPQNDCSFYLYLHDAQKNLFLLFPDTPSFWDTPRRIDRSYALPSGDGWFRLDAGSGIETFYLILSDHRLRALETKTAVELQKNPSRGILRSIVRPFEVLEEIRRIIVDSSALAEAAEKPAAVAGDFRGIQEDTGLNGIAVETQGVYVRTIRLEH